MAELSRSASSKLALRGHLARRYADPFFTSIAASRPDKRAAGTGGRAAINASES